MSTTLTYTERPWPDGPWMAEPDREIWIDEATGYDCLVRRHEDSGHLCGYVAVPKSHIMSGVAWSVYLDDAETEEELLELFRKKKALDGLDVHGGITYGNECSGDPVLGVCHVPRDGGEDEVWWLGFDMAHYNDLRPETLHYEALRLGYEPHGVYRTFDYVKAECVRFAAQLKALEVRA